MRYDGSKNLIRNEDRTPEERRENARKAGKASVEARRRKKNMRQLMRELLDLEPANEGWNDLAAMGVAPQDITNEMLLLVRLFQTACCGNVQAVREIRSILGTEAGSLEKKERKARIRKLNAEADAAENAAKGGQENGIAVQLEGAVEDWSK